MRNVKAIGYRRVSTLQQRLGGYSLPQQKLEIEAYAATHNISLVADYADDQTGSNTDRPGLEQALADLETGRATALIICENDRLTRSAPDYMWLRETLREMGRELHNARRGQIDLNDFGSQIVEDVYGRVAEMERERIVRRMRDGKLSKARQGKIVNPTMLPYGYKATDGVVTVADKEAEVVQDIFNRYAGGETLAAIADELSRRRVPTYMDIRQLAWTSKKSGRGRWSKSSVKRILKNETYLGRWHYNKTDGDGLPNDRREWVVVTVPPIIDEAIFEAARQRLGENRRLARRNTRREYLAQGRVTCTCGKTMRSYTSQRRGKAYSYYTCQTCKNLRAGDVDAVLWGWIKRMLSEPEYMTKLINDYLDHEDRAQGDVTGRLVGVRANIDRNMAQQRRFAQMFVNGAIDDEALAGVGESLRAEKADLVAEERRLVAELGNLAQARDHAAEILNVMSTFSHGLRFFNDEPFYIRRVWVEALNARVEILPGAEQARFTCLWGHDVLSIVDTEFRCRAHNWSMELVAVLPLRMEVNCGGRV